MSWRRRTAAAALVFALASAAFAGAPRIWTTGPALQPQTRSPAPEGRDELRLPRLSWPPEGARLPALLASDIPARNPFTFSRAASAQRPRSSSAVRPSAAQHAAVPVAPPAAVVTLIGVTETVGPEGIIRIAILAGEDDQLWMLRNGEPLVSHERVDHIGPDSVTLADDRTGARRRLELQ